MNAAPETDETTADATEMWATDVEAVHPENAREMLRLAEMRSQAIFQASIAMDQRAAVLATGFVAAAGALGAAGIATWGMAAPWSLGALVTAAGLSIAAGLSAYVTRPQKSQFPGFMPIMWVRHKALLTEPKRDLDLSLACLLQEDLGSNEKQQSRNGRFLLWAMVVAAMSAPVGFAAAWIMTLMAS